MPHTACRTACLPRRTPIYAVVRPLGYLSPSVRNTRHAAAQLLAQPASPGLLGMLADLKRLMLASRVTGTGEMGAWLGIDPLQFTLLKMPWCFPAALREAIPALLLLLAV